MQFSYKILKAAQRDYEESIFWYSEKSLMVAGKFLEALENSLQILTDNPLVYKKGYNGNYKYLTKNFPFTIFYTIDETKHLILIRAIYHQKRNPQKKYR